MGKKNLSIEDKARLGILVIDIMTKKELLEKRKTYQSYRSSIAKHSRSTYFNSGKPKACAVCGYNKHIEIAHVISVSSFSDDTFIGEINDIKNLIPLCPNHHWEFDNNLLEFR